MARPDEVAQFIALRDELSGKNSVHRDSNGFRKILVLLTRSGKVGGCGADVPLAPLAGAHRQRGHGLHAWCTGVCL